MSNRQEVIVPDIGDFDEVDVIEIIVSVGDRVEVEDPLISLESDKATMDVPAPNAGIVEQIMVGVGDKVAQGSIIAIVAVDDAEATDVAPEQPASPEPADPSPPPSTPTPTAPPEPNFAKSKPTPPNTLPPPVDRAGDAIPHASPGIRRFARELGAELNLIKGSGAKGRILKSDVQGFVKSALSNGTGNQRADSGHMQGIEPIPTIDFSQFGETETVELSRIKRISGPHLHRVWVNVPHVTHHDEADVTDLEEFRKSLKAEAESRDVKITPLAFIMKALVAALRQFPDFNSSLSPDGKSLILKNYYNIGIAVDTPGGLVVPVIRDVDQQGVFELSAALGEVSQRARDSKLKPQDMQGGCMSISSLGGIGGTAFTPIINAPEVAILGVTRTQVRPVYDGSNFIPRKMLPLDLSYDHRVIDGAQAARFMVYLCSLLSDIRRLTI